MDRTLGVVLLPVADIDRAITSYRDGVGFRLDHRTATEQPLIPRPAPGS